MQTLNLDAYPTETTFGFPEAQIISITNTGAYPITYNFDAGVTSSGNVTLQPGQSSNDTRTCTNLHLLSSNGIQSLQVTIAFELSHQIGNLSITNVSALKGMNVSVGQYVRTLGYYVWGDGGGAQYVIVAAGTGTADDGMYINLNNGLQAKLLPDKQVDIRVFGAKAQAGFDNQPIIKKIIDCQVTYSFSQCTIIQLFDIIIPVGTWEVHSPIYLSPFITIKGQANHVITNSTDIAQGCILNAVGDFTGKAIIDTAIYYQDGTRKPLLDDSPGNIYDNHYYNPCGNVTLQGFAIQSDPSYTVNTCAFEAIHLCGSSGSIVKDVLTMNTIQGITVESSWQYEVEHNKMETYWIGGLFYQNTSGWVQLNYFPRNATQRTTTWSQVSTRPFLTQIGGSGTSFLKQIALGMICIRGGVNFEHNDIEAFDNGFGIDYQETDWVMKINNTYMEKITNSAYVIYTTNVFDIFMGTMVNVTNLLNVSMIHNDSYGTSVPIINLHSQKGTEFTQGYVTNIGTITGDNGSEKVVLHNFQEANRKYGNYVYYASSFMYDNGTGKLVYWDGLNRKDANNVYPTNIGINISVPATATGEQYTFSTPEYDANYAVVVTPGWNTTCYVSQKTVNSFVVTFGTPPSVTSTLDWMIRR